MAYRLEIAQRGVVHTVQTLNGITHRAEDVRPAWNAIEEDLERMMAAQFASGAGWQPVADSTVARDQRGNRDPRLMRASGALEKSLTQAHAQGAIRDKTPREMRFGTSLFYADFHQRGLGVPKRVLLNADDVNLREVASDLERYLVGRPSLRI